MKTDALIHELSTQARPVTRIAHPVVGFARWALVAALCLGVGIAAFGLRPDMASAVRNPTFLVLALLTLALGACLALSAFLRSVPDSAEPWHAAVPAAILALGIAVLAHALSSADSIHAGFGATCVARILAIALVPSVLLVRMLRRAAPLDAGRVGALAALGAVAIGALGTQFICRHDDPLHILVWHYVPMALLGGLGTLFGRLLLRWDRR